MQIPPKIPKELSKDNIYLKKRNKCSSTDIGEPGQTLKQRDIGQKSDIKTDACIILCTCGGGGGGGAV